MTTQNRNRAISYNAGQAEKGAPWYGQVPLGARKDYPGLALDCLHGFPDEKEEFALGVAAYQDDHNETLTVDGMLGPATWASIQSEYDDETIPVDFDLAGAVRYNQFNADKVGWTDQIPRGASQEYPSLLGDAVSGAQGEKELFAEAVHSFQSDQNFSPADLDGKLGPYTWATMERIYTNPVSSEDRYYIFGNKRYKSPNKGCGVVPFDQEGGLDLHRAGHFSSRNGAKPRLLVIHWGGIDPFHLYRVFNGDRKVSSHGGVGYDKQEVKFYQYLDLQHSAWHAGYVNKFSIGIDICQQPTTEWLSYYQSRSYDVDNVKNNARRPDGRVIGDYSVLSIDSDIATATLNVVQDICSLFDIPMRAPRGSDGLQDKGELWHGVFSKRTINDGKFSGVVGHHHLSAQKWDMACWWNSIFHDTQLG